MYQKLGVCMELNISDLDSIVDEVISGLKKAIADDLESIVLTGSYAIGKISKQRPDVNIVVFLKGYPKPINFLSMGEMFYKVASEFNDKFSVRIDLSPFRFAYPIGKKDLEVSIHLLILAMGQKDSKPPFNIPDRILHGMSKMQRVVYGPDVFGTMQFNLSPEALRAGIQWDLVQFKLQIERAPFTYDITKDYGLLATESLELGKIAIYAVMELLMEDSEIQAGKHVQLISNKEELHAYLVEKAEAQIARNAETILTARASFSEWKNDRKKAENLYKAAFGLISAGFRLLHH